MPEVNVIVELMEALKESLKLQAHYAELLNHYDGGQRRIFKDPKEWLDRLKEIRERDSRTGLRSIDG